MLQFIEHIPCNVCVYTQTQNCLNYTFLTKWDKRCDIQNDTSCTNMEVWDMVSYRENGFNIQITSHSKT